jgi:hypothetical protein
MLDCLLPEVPNDLRKHLLKKQGRNTGAFKCRARAAVLGEAETEFLFP